MRFILLLLGLALSGYGQGGPGCVSQTCVDWLTQIKNRPGTSLGYVVNVGALPLFIPQTSHLQGANITVDCWSGALNANHITGNKVYCEVDLDPLGSGDVTIRGAQSSVGSVIISSVASPYVASATGSGMTITSATHKQGANIAVDCWSGAPVNGKITGAKVFCQTLLNTAGNGSVTVTYGGASVGSVIVSGVTSPVPYVANVAGTCSGFVCSQVIPPQVHQQGPNVSVECWNGPLVSGKITGTKVLCQPILDNSGSGQVTVKYGPGDIKSVIVSASGPNTTTGPAGPAGPQGPPGPAGSASSYFTASTTSPQTILTTTHMQGTKAEAICFDGPIVGGQATGNVVICGIDRDATGNFVIAWGSNSVASIQIKQ